MFIVSVLVATILTLVVFSLVAQNNYGPLPFSLWLISIVSLFLGLRQTHEKNHHLRKKEYLWLATLPVYFFRLLFLFWGKSLPFHGDEAIVSENALLAFNGGLSGKWEFFGAKMGTLNFFPALWYYPQGFLIRILGPSLSSAKLLSLVTDLAICLLIYFIAKKWLNRSKALAASLIYASLPIAIHFSMTGYQNIQSTLFLLLSLFAALKRKEDASSKTFLIPGIFCGLGMYFYLASLINPLILTTIFFFWFRKNIKKFFSKLFFFAFGFLITTSPYLSYSLFQESFISQRSNTYNFWLGEASVGKTLLLQVGRFFSGFYPLPMNGSGMHYLDLPALPNLLSFIIFIVGLIAIARRLIKNLPGAFELIIIFISTSLLGGILTENPPAPQRLIHLFPVIAFVIFFGIEGLTNLSQTILKKKSISQPLFWSLVLIIILGDRLSFYKKNLPLYQESNPTEISFVNYCQKSNLRIPILTHIPIHKVSQIFFYSKGAISPQPIDYDFELNQARDFLYLSDYDGLDLIRTGSEKKLDRLEFDNHEDLFLFHVQDIPNY